MKISQNSLTLSYFLILIKTILFLTITSLSFANEKKIGSVTELKGTIVAITEELDERDLLIHDPIFINEEIFVRMKVICAELQATHKAFMELAINNLIEEYERKNAE